MVNDVESGDEKKGPAETGKVPPDEGDWVEVIAPCSPCAQFTPPRLLAFPAAAPRSPPRSGATLLDDAP
jgi:hypothetical protein